MILFFIVGVWILRITTTGREMPGIAGGKGAATGSLGPIKKVEDFADHAELQGKSLPDLYDNLRLRFYARDCLQNWTQFVTSFTASES